MSVYPCPKCSVARADLESACEKCGWSPNQQRSTGTVASGSYMSASPYAASSIEYDQPTNAARGSTQNTPGSLYLLLLAMLLTAMLAAINSIQELHPLWPWGLWFAFLSVISQSPGLLVAIWYWKTRSVASAILLVAACLIAMSSITVYAIYVSRPEPADSINSAAHMHVIFFPVVHCFFALLIYTVSGIVIAAVYVSRALLKARRRQQ